MQATARELADDQIEVVYEQALHDPVREKIKAKVAKEFILAIFGRDRLVRVTVPSAEQKAAADGGS
jgi:hypothetical protein